MDNVMNKVDMILEQWKKLQSQRLNWENGYQAKRFYYFPNAEDLYSTEEEGQEVNVPVDGTGIEASHTLASSLYSFLFPPGNEWYQLSPVKSKEDDYALVSYLTNLGKFIQELIQTSNFNLQSHEMLHHYVVFNIACFYEEITDDYQLRFRNYDVNTVWVDEDINGVVDTLFMKMTRTAKQLWDKYGEDCSENVKKFITEKDIYHEIEVLYGVYPRIERNKSKWDKKNMPFESIVIEIEEKHIMNESGYKTFPYQVPRFFKNGNNKYGRGASDNALPDMKMLNRIAADVIDAVEMVTAPPVFVPNEDTKYEIALEPRMIIPIDMRDGQLPVPYNAENPNLAIDFQLRLEERVKRFFFNDLFMALEGQKNMTATEVQNRIDEKIQAITPIVSRLTSELMEPMIKRIVAIVIDKGMFPEPPPDGFKESDYQVRFTSRLDAKLKQIENTNMLMAINEASQAIAALESLPTLGAMVKSVNVVRAIFRSHNVDPDILNDDDDIEQQLNAMKEQAQMQQQQEAMSKMMKPVDAQKTPEEGSLTQMMMPE